MPKLPSHTKPVGPVNCAPLPLPSRFPDTVPTPARVLTVHTGTSAAAVGDGVTGGVGELDADGALPMLGDGEGERDAHTIARTPLKEEPPAPSEMKMEPLRDTATP